MYEAFYGFTGRPFQLNPDPRFFFASRQHKRAMSFVEYGLHQAEGFIVVTGEVGAGKTTVVRNLIAGLDPGKVVAAHLVSTQLEADDTLRMVAAGFGVAVRDASKSELLLGLEACLAAHAAEGRRCLLLVDEAQNLAPRAVEELRMLSNFQLGTHALLQSFLVGQPEFRHILRSPQFNQLRQRVIAACHIGPLEEDDTRAYIEHRLRVVGWKGSPLVLPEAFEAVHAASGGIPRRINLLFDRLLLSGFLSEKRIFTKEMVREVAEEIHTETLAPDPVPGDRQEPGAPSLERPGAARPAGTEPARPGAPPSAGQTPPVAVTASGADNAIEDIRRAIERVEQENRAALGNFQRFLDWVRPRDRGPDGRP